MAFDFMKNFLMLEDEEKFARLCETLEEALNDVESRDGKFSDLEVMQALDYIGFNLFRDDWEEFKKMDMHRNLGGTDFNGANSKNQIH
ncbi:MAG: hypothetical protein G3M78_10940 [Candidatus Nitrohelix vancouverensis]|uniref:Uncharacterized protein n=1 Tax=Candidatus Nitrohelix vancouverensis TaxID=2705534 RepID=A0A7T0G3Y8_9BACT|nr:MAG: hypothetical protein G3M78_10940 [Candidatus Nitrohelix vancouverensis]